MRIFGCWWLCWWISWGLTAQSLEEQRLDFSWSAGPAAAALLRLADSADVNLTLPTKLLRDRRVAAGRLRDAPLPVVLDSLLRHSDVGYRPVAGGLVFYRRPPARRTVSGYVRDAASGERLIGATLYDPASGEGCVTNAFGFYSYPFRTDIRELLVSYLGYATGRVRVAGAIAIDIGLRPDATLQEVVVLARADSLAPEGRVYDPLRTPYTTALPVLGNGTDPWRLLGLEAGVRTAADGFGGLHVRGGGSDQNLILLDDVPIYHPTHTFGLFSIFNTALVRSSRFYRDGFPARYEGRNSSVLDVRTREGNTERPAGEVQLGTFTSSALLEMPLPGGRGGLLLGGRHSHVDYWLDGYSRRRLAGPGRTGVMRYRLYDLNLKGHYRFGRRHRLYASYYRGGDRFGQELTLRPAADTSGFGTRTDQARSLDWGNEIGSVRHNWQVGERLFINTTITYSDFTYRSTASSTVSLELFADQALTIRQRDDYRSRIQDYSIRTDADIYWNARHRLRAGLHTNRRVFSPGLLRSRLLTNLPDSLNTLPAGSPPAVRLATSELTAYLEEQYTHRRWSVRAGVRVAAFYHSNRRALPFQPRLEAAYRLRPAWYLAGTFTRTAQFVQLLTTTDAGLPQDLWVPTPVGSAPQAVRQWSASSYGRWRATWFWRVGVYHKQFDNLLRLRPELRPDGGGGTVRIDAANFSRSVETGTGSAAGLELTLERRAGALTGRLVYSYLDAKRRFRDAPAVYPYDQRHAASVRFAYALGRRWQLGLIGQWQSGRAIAPGATTLPFGALLDRGTLPAGTTRLPAYHRADASAQYRWGTRFDHRIHFSLYNLYDRQNTLFGSAATDSSASLPTTAALPRLPFLSYRFRW